jgi:hypothetical protein
MNTRKQEQARLRSLLLTKLNPDPDSLLIAISKHVDDSMLKGIAQADYGYDADLNFEQLRKIRDEQVVFAPMPWNPKEVLELTRWTTPNKMRLSPRKLLQLHRIRAFVCAALLRAMAEPLNEGYFGGDNDTIAPLLESLLVLDLKVQKAAVRFFAWRVQHLSSYDVSVNPFYLLALLILFLRTEANIRRIELKTIIDWIYAEVRTAYQVQFYTRYRAKKAQWLTWLTVYNQRHMIWLDLGREIATIAENYGNSEGRQNLKSLAHHLETYKK